MKTDPKSESKILRQKAEKKLKALEVTEFSEISKNEILRLVHELQVHQIELEAQNEELILANEKTELAKEQYINLYNFAPSGFVTLSKECEIINLNFCAANILGKERLKLTNKHFALFVSVQTRPVFYSFFEKIITNKKTKETCEVIIETAGNLPIYVNIDGIFSESDNLCLLTIVDNTERKQAVEIIKLNEERLTTAQRVAKIGNWETDLSDLSVIWSDETFRIFEIDKKKFKPSHPDFLNFVHPEDRAKVDSAFLKSFKHDKNNYIEHRIITPKGKVKFVEEHWQINYNNKALPIKAFGTCQDITERKQIEEALVASKKSYSAIFEQSPIAIGFFDADGSLINVNNAGINLFGIVNIDEIIGLKLFEDSNIPDNIKTKLLNGKSVRFEANFNFEEVKKLNIYKTTRSGIIKLDWSITPLKDGDSVIGYIDQLQDITDRKKREDILVANEAYLNHLITDSPAVIYSCEPSGNFAANFVSENIKNQLGYESHEYTKTPSFWINHLHPDDTQNISKELSHLFNLSKHTHEYRFRHSDGNYRWMRDDMKLIRDDEGNPKEIIGSLIDITKRKLAEDKLAETSKLLEQTSIMSKIGGWDLNLLSGELIWSNEVYRIHEVDPSIKPSVAQAQDFYAPEVKKQLEAMIANAIKHGIPWKYELPMTTAKGKHIWVKGQGYAQMENGKAIKLSGTFQDITERKHVESKLSETHEQLKLLYRHQNEIRENERKIISREIHDELGQSLSALKLDLGWTKDNVSGHPAVSGKINIMIDIVSDILKNVQQISADLRPGILDDLGLISAMEWYCQEFEKRTKIKCIFKPIDILILNSSKKLSLYRVLQEALTNVLRHAGANKVKVRIYLKTNFIILKIKDNGIGITPEKIKSGLSLGIMGMRERANQFNGILQIKSDIGKGTELIFVIPFEKNEIK